MSDHTRKYQPGPTVKRQMRALLPSTDAELRDIARVPYQSYAPPVPARPFGSGPYSAAVLAVQTSYNPKPHSQYR